MYTKTISIDYTSHAVLLTDYTTVLHYTQGEDDV